MSDECEVCEESVESIKKVLRRVVAIHSSSPEKVTAMRKAAMAAAAILAKYGLKLRSLKDSNILNPETDVERMVSTQILRVKDAPEMGLIECVKHFAFLLSEEHVNFFLGSKVKSFENLKTEIEIFRNHSLRKHKISTSSDYMVMIEKSQTSSDDMVMVEKSQTSSDDMVMVEKSHDDSFRHTVEAATKMFERNLQTIEKIDKFERDVVLAKAENCLLWAHDEDVTDIHNMTCDQAAAIMLYTQETCLYHRLNAALRTHDTASLMPFLPFLKLLLSALYRLPLTRVRTYRGVKLELFKTYNQLVGKVWTWWGFSSATRDKNILFENKMFLGSSGQRTLFCLDAVGVDIAQFSAIPAEQEVLLLPGLPLMNQTGQNMEADLWSFEIKTPDASVDATDQGVPAVRIDYVHPGWESFFHRSK